MFGGSKTHHSHDPSNNTQPERGTRGQAHGQNKGVVPTFQVVICEIALAEEVVFRENDDKVACAPVSQQRQEILEIHHQLMPSRKRKRDDDTETSDRP